MADLDKLYEKIVTYSERQFRTLDKLNRRDYTLALRKVKAVVADAYGKYGQKGTLTYAEMQKYERIVRLDKQLSEAIDGNVRNVAKRTRNILKETAIGSYDKSVEIIALKTGVEITKALTTDQITALLQKPISGLTLNERMALRVTDLKMRVTAEVKRKILQEAPIEDTWKGVKTVMEKVYVKDRTMLGDDTHRVSQESIRASLESGKEKGLIPTLTWITAGDDRVREAHAALDGQTIDVTEKFKVPSGEWKGYETDVPGEFGEPALDYNCRCWVVGDARARTDEEQGAEEPKEPLKLERTIDQRHEQYLKLKETYKEYTPSQEGSDIIRGYTGGEYRHYNSILRRGESSDRIETMIKTIDSAPPLPQGIEMYRGLGFDTATKIIDAPIGSLIEDTAFQSFSENINIARKFTTSPKGVDQPLLLRVITSGGEKGIPTSITGSAHPEQEIIMQAGSKWKIINKEVIQYKGDRDYEKIPYTIINLVRI